MSKAALVVTAVLIEGRTRSEVAREYGLSRRWVSELVVRYQAEGEAGLQPRSRRPHTNPRAIPRELEEQIITLRKQLNDLGLDAGAATIAAHLHRSHGTSPAVSTIWRILTRRGFVTPQPRKRPRTAMTRFVADQPNERWQADTTHWHLADDTGVEILNILDDHSRLAVASTTLAVFTAGDVVDAFTDAYCHHGLPHSVLTDNGAIFTGRSRGHGKVALERQLDLLHIRAVHSRPYHPQTCGKVERFHQTLKKWLAAHDPADTLADLQAQLDEFVDYYNHTRPHRALGRATPAEAYAARPKAGPTHRPLGQLQRLRRDTVDKAGVVTLRHDSRLHHIGIGKRHTGTRVLMLVDDRHIRIIAADTGELLRDLTLDPTRDYQPRGVKPGPPKAPTCNDVPRHV